MNPQSNGTRCGMRPGSILSECQILRDGDLKQVNFTLP